MDIEVSAFDAAGASKPLDATALSDVLALLVKFEDAMRLEITQSKAGGPMEMAAVNRFSRSFRALGMDVQWFDKGPAPDKALFTAKLGAEERKAYCLKDLLSLAREAGVIARPEGAKPESPGAPAAQAPAFTPQDRLILIVDDDETLREMIAYVFKKEGFKVETFADGVDLLKAVPRLMSGPAPDLIIMDLMMPRQGGYEVVRELQMGEAGRVPIIVITGRDLDAHMSQMLQQEPNVAQFMTKPIIPKDLSAAAKRIFEKASAA